MKVAYLALGENYGGNDAGFVHTHSVVKFLSEAGVGVRLFIGGPENDMKPDVDAEFVRLPCLSNVFRTNPFRFIREYSRMKKMLKDCDIVHERFHVNPIDLLFVGGRKYVLEVNDPAIELAHGWRKYLYRWLVRMKYNRADAIVVQTETLKKIVSRHTSTPVYVVPNGVDVSRFGPDVKCGFRKKYSIRDDEVVVTFVGSFREWHGVLDVIEIAKRVPSARFVMVGNGKLFDEVKSRARGIENLLLTGAVSYDDVPGIMGESDVLIAPFNTSGFPELEQYGFWWCPVKLFEYMASGKPVVSYDFPEVRNIVRDGGFLAKVGDMEGFAEYLSKVVGDSEVRGKTGDRALKIARSEYSWSLCASKIIKIYELL